MVTDKNYIVDIPQSVNLSSSTLTFLDISSIANSYLEGAIIKGSITLQLSSSSNFSAIVELKKVDSFNNATLIGSQIFLRSMTSLTFDISSFLNNREFLTHSLAVSLLFNPIGNITLLDSLTNESFITMTINPFEENSNLKSIVSNSIGQYGSFSFNHLTQGFTYRINLFSGLLSYDVSLVYSSTNNVSKNFMPNGWKLSILDYLDLSHNVSDGYIIYVDKNNQKHRFNPIENYSNHYYSIDGTGLILWLSGSYYYLASELSSLPYKKFMATNGRLIEVNGRDGENLFVDYQTNYLTIEDYKNNQIKVSISGNYVSIYLNDTLYYILSLLDNLLSSFNYNSKADSFTYTDSLLSVVTTRDNYSLFINRTNSLVTNLIYKHNTSILENLTFDYEALRTYITNRHGVKMLYGYDKNLNLINSGEVVDGEINELFIRSESPLYSDLSLSLTNPSGSIFNFNNSTSVSLNQSTNAEEQISSITKYDINSGSASFIKKDKSYILLITLKKESDYTFTSAKKAWAELYLDDVGNTETLIEPIEFDPISKNQTVAVMFNISADEFFPTKYLKIYLKAKGLNDEGGVTFSNVLVLEFKGKQVTYYQSTGLEHVDGYDGLLWQKTNPYVDDDTVYSYNDILRNYMNNISNSHLYWSNDFHNVTYNPNNANTYGGGYRFHIFNVNSLYNIFLGKKTLIKEYYDDDELKQIYTFEYIRKVSNEYIYTFIQYIEGESFKTTKTYDNDFYLTREDKSNGDYVQYIYDSNHKIIKTISGNSNSTKVFVNNYAYDSARRLISESSLLSNFVVTNSYSYVDNKLELLSKTTDPSNVDEEYSYSSLYEYESKIEKGNSEINKNLSNETQSIYSNDSSIKILKNNLGDFGTLRIKSTSSTYQTVESLWTTLGLFGDSINHNNENKELYNLYDKLVNKLEYSSNQSAFVNAASYLYFDKKPDDITQDEQVDPPASTSKSKLYKVIDSKIQHNYYFDYNEDGQLSSYLEVNPDLVFASFNLNVEYDLLSRLSRQSFVIDFSNIFSFKHEYFDYFSNDVSCIRYYGLNTLISNHSVTITKDSLSRISDITYSFNSYSRKAVYIYNSLDVTENNETVHLASPLVRRIDHYSIVNNTATYKNSEHLSYDSRGNLTSLKPGNMSRPQISKGVSYQYDSNNRLTNEDNKDIGCTYSYQYDDNGNITSVTKSTDPNNPITYQYHTYYKDLLVSFNNNQITYNDRYEPLTYGNNVSFSWANGKLTQINNSNNITSFEYDYKGVRKYKYSPNGDTHEYFTLGNRIIVEKVTHSNNSVDYLKYLYGQLGIFGLFVNNTFYYLKRNALGDITEIYDSTNSLVAKYIYDAWGNHKVFDSNNNELTYASNPTHIGIINPFRYRGYYYDAETGLYYCLTRYYNPEWRRWISPDKARYLDPSRIDGINLFAYCLNNPVKYTDEEGESITLLIVGFIIGAAIGAATSVISQGLTVGWENINGWQVLLDAAIGGLGGLVSFGGLGVIATASLQGAIGFVGSVSSDLLASNGDWSSINWRKATMIGIINGGISFFIGKAGVQNSEEIINSTLSSLSKQTGCKALCTAIQNGSSLTGLLNLYSKQLVSYLATLSFDIITERIIKAVAVTIGSSIISSFVANYVFDGILELSND